MGLDGQHQALVALPPGKEPELIVQEIGWASGASWTSAEGLTPTWAQTSNRSAGSVWLYRLLYAAHNEKREKICDYKTCLFVEMYRGADKSLARPGRKQATATEDFDFIYPIYNHNWRNISTIYVYKKTNVKRNILTIRQNTSGSRSG